MRDKRNGVLGLMLAIGLGAAGCAAEVGGAEDDVVLEQAALTSPDAGAQKAQKQPAEVATQQYLQLQSAMQQQNRAYTALSNILKAKQDTAKGTISNIR